MRRLMIFILLILTFLGITFACQVGGRPPLIFSPDELPDAEMGQPYRTTITVSDFETPVFHMAVLEGTLPAGFTLEYVSGETAILTGTPEETGRFEFVVQAMCYGTNTSGQVGEKTYTLMVTGADQYVIREGAELMYGALTVEVGKIEEGTYVDESGVEKTGLTTEIRLMFQNDPTLDQTLRAHPGQELSAGDFYVRVIEIAEDDQGMYVLVEIK